jgi:hypothetical protein
VPRPWIWTRPYCSCLVSSDGWSRPPYLPGRGDLRRSLPLNDRKGRYGSEGPVDGDE